MLIAILTLAWGFHKRDGTGHLLSSGGWVAWGFYWLFQTPAILIDEGDLFNGLFMAGAVPFFWGLAYHEFLFYQGRGMISEEDGEEKELEDNHSLKFLAGTGFIAGGIYFLIEYVEPFHVGLIWFTAYLAQLMLQLFGYDIALGEVLYQDKIRVPILKDNHAGTTDIYIVLACTAIQSLVIFIGAIYSTRGPMDRKFKAFMYTVPVVFFLNVIRNAGVIWLVYEGHLGFEMAHSYLARYGAMLGLVILTFIMFSVLPELHEDIMGVMDLYYKPVWDWLEQKGFVEKKKETSQSNDKQPETDSGESLSLKVAKPSTEKAEEKPEN